MSLLEELGADADDTGPHRRGSVVDELTGKDSEGEADAAEEETRAAAKEELGQEALTAVKGNDAKALYEVIAKIAANEG